MFTPEEEVQRKLAKVDEEALHGGLSDMRFFTLRKVLLGILFAVAASVTVIAVIELNKPPPPAPAAAKPLQVQILPGK
jgi:hypothetical protein